VHRAAPAVLACLLLAGCSDPPAAAEVAAGPGLFIEGLVVTQAIVPIADAAVTLLPGELSGTTDAGGLFRLGPLAAGSYQVVVKADGYADQVVQAQAGGELLKVVLANTRSDVPYIEVLKFDGYLMCTTDQNLAGYQVVGAPCFGVVDIVTGQQVSQDYWQFEFPVDAPGLAGILVEMVWEEQALGTNMGILLRNVVGAGGGIDAGGTNTDIQYASGEGPSPLQVWVHQGIENPGADEGAAFQVPQNDTMRYKALVLGRADDSKPADVHLMLENRPQVFVTKFFHAPGDPSYSVLNA
jgi:hypothetical protein